MVDFASLNREIEKSGKKKKIIAKDLGISSRTLRAKLCGKSDLTVAEVDLLCASIGLTNTKDKINIFFK